MKKKILFFMRDLLLAGGEKCVVSIINNLDRSKFSPVLAVLDLSGPLKEDLRDDVVVHAAGKAQGGICRFVSDFAHFYLFLQKVIAVESPDVLFCSNWITSIIGGYFSRRISNGPRFVVVSHTPIGKLLGKSSFFNLFVPVKYVMTRALVTRADAVIALTELMKEDIVKFLGIERSRLTVIYNGIDIDENLRLRGLPDINTETRTPFIISVGRLSSEKGHETLVRAFGKIANCIEHHLIIIGEGEMRHALEALIGSEGLSNRVTLAGARLNPFPDMRQADFFVLPSYWETFPYVLLEALSLEVPIIATASDGSREILDDGSYGLLVPPGNVRALADAMLRFATDQALRNTYREKSLARAREFSFDRMMMQYEMLFGTL